ncbi:HAUS augmin-like complex subunit 1 isoform X2 [Acanthaster planci]|uniref:HAUS augmin-like complex subunit 1 isoform X2 n=1 Tax=Acanthaster planci TaxID=133434 RepID=A0A8B7ZGH6_ACAPL|nr:HAUS augmin-like complex subunit 1 isoform X2 [Acanthaster planci]
MRALFMSLQCSEKKTDVSIITWLAVKHGKMSSDEVVSERHREVRAWLERTFAGAAIPQYEINERTMEILQGLMTRNQERDREAQIVTEDAWQKTEEYNTEAIRLAGILQSVGLSATSLSQSGNVSLRTLASVAGTLEVKDASTSSYLLAMMEMSKVAMETEEARQQEKRLSEQLFSKTKAALIKCNTLRKALQALEEQAEFQGPELEKKNQQAGVLNSKAKEYQAQLHQLQMQLERNNVEPSLYHQSLVKLSEELVALNAKLAPLKSKLDSYHNLPPDISLAKVRIEEAKRELGKMEAELSRNIDMMHM